MKTAYLHLFIDRGSGGNPGRVIGWEIGSELPQSQFFDGSQTAQALCEQKTAMNYETAALALEREVGTLPQYAWLRKITRRWALQARGGNVCAS